MFKFLVCLLLVSAGRAAPAPAGVTSTDNSNTLGKSLPGINDNVGATELYQPNKASEGLVKSTSGVVLESSSADDTQIQTSAYPFILEEPHLNNAMISSISILKELNPDSDFKFNLNESKSKTSSTIHIINHTHSGKGNVTKKVPKLYVDKFLNNSFDSILSKAVLPVKETKWQNSERKSKRINPTRTLSDDKKNEMCANATLPATDKSDKIVDQKGPEVGPKTNTNSISSVKSETNVKDSHNDVTGQKLLSHNDSSVSKELDNRGRKAKVLDNGRLRTESESALVQLEPGHDAPTASQGRVESLTSHVEQNSANQPLESHKSPLEKNNAINNNDDKIQSIVSVNNILNKEKQEKKEDRNEVKNGKADESATTNTSENKKSIKDTNVSSAPGNFSDLSTTVKNIEVGVTQGLKKNIDSLQTELDRGLIALNVFQKLSELLDLNDISKKNPIVDDAKLISKDENTISLQSSVSLKNESEMPKKILSQNVDIASKLSGTSIPVVDSQLKLTNKVNVAENGEARKKTDPKVIDDQKLNNELSSSRGSFKFEKNSLSLNDVSQNTELNQIAPLTALANVTTLSSPVNPLETKVTSSPRVQTVENNVTTPSSLVRNVQTNVKIPLAEVKTKVTTSLTENITPKNMLIKKLESSTASTPSSGTPKSYQDSNNFRQSANLSQNKYDENQSLNSQAKPVEGNASNKNLDESTINPVTPRQGRGQVTQTVQWIKITPPAKINNDENLEVQEANYLTRAAKNQFQSNNNYPLNIDASVPQHNAGADKSLEESKFVKIIPAANQGMITAIPKLSQSFEISSEKPSYSSPKYIVSNNTPKSINDKESFSTPGPFSYSTANNINKNYYLPNPTPSPVENNHESTSRNGLNQPNESVADPQINRNVNTERYENQQSRYTPTVGKIYTENIAQSRDAYKNLQEISLDTPKEREPPKDIVNVAVETVSDGNKNVIRRINPNVARNNNNFESVSPSNEPSTRGVNKYKSNRFDTISAFTTDSQINKLFTESSTTKSQYNPVTQRSRNRVTSSTTTSSLLQEEKSIIDKRNEEKRLPSLKASDAKETPKGKYAVRTSRGNIKYVKNPYSGDWLGDGDDKYPPQFSYNYKTATGISAYQKGVLTEINDRKVFVIHGSYNYTAPDGTPIIMSYTADEFGFHPQQTVSNVVQNKLEPSETKDFNKELGKRRAKMVRKAQYSERMNLTETDHNDSEEEKPTKVGSHIVIAEVAEEPTKLAQAVNGIARGRGRNIYREVDNNQDVNNVREVKTIEADEEIKTPQRIIRRRNPNPTVPLEST